MLSATMQMATDKKLNFTSTYHEMISVTIVHTESNITPQNLWSKKSFLFYKGIIQYN